MVCLLGGRFDRSQSGNDLHMPLILFLLLALDVIHAGLDVPEHDGADRPDDPHRSGE